MVYSPTLEEHKLFDKPDYMNRYNRREDQRQKKAQWAKTHPEYQKTFKEHLYLTKRIVAIDGEGVNIRTGARKGAHDYILLALSGAEPLTDARPGGLSTAKILDYLFDHLSSSDLNVIYGGSYDFNMWVKDLDPDQLRKLYRGGYNGARVMFHGYSLKWMKGKAFEITKHFPNKKHRTVVINDTVSFFQRSFIDACDEYLQASPTYDRDARKHLVRMKKARGNFRASEILAITKYNDLELTLIVELITELRARLHRVGLKPRRWNSPGAIAVSLFDREGVKKHRNENLPEEVQRAARYAYAGGRFEPLKYGASKDKAYEYDINSAYPRALLEVPSLAQGSWDRRTDCLPTTQEGLTAFALYHVSYHAKEGTSHLPGPLFCRSAKGAISYPMHVSGWYWTPEIESLMEYCEATGGTYTIQEAWEFTPGSDVKPFAFIAELYTKRQELKAKGDGAHVGIKLALNSLYGKTAQQVGFKPATDKFPVRVPSYHQLEWAGYVTSWCRSRVLRAALLDLDSVIAFETDALFTNRKLPLADSKELGGWERVEFTNLTYVQSGHYYGTVSEKEIVKCRGIDKGFIDREKVEALLSTRSENRILPAQLTRFYGAGIALARGLDKYWRKWLTEEKRLNLQPMGKRIHIAGLTCECETSEGLPLTLGEWHSTGCPIPGGESCEYPVKWINPNEEMTELEDYRDRENFYEKDYA